MRKSVIALIIAAFSILWTPCVWAHSTHYGSVSVSKIGEGTVYLSTSDKATSGDESATWSCGRSPSKDSATFYLYAQPSAGWDFVGWSGLGTSSDSPYEVTLNAQNGKRAFTATFAMRRTLSFQATENGTYSATDGTATIAATSEAKSLSTGKEVTMTAAPAAGFTVKEWWYQEEGGSRVSLGKEKSYKHVFEADATIGVEFMAKGETIVNKTTGEKFFGLAAAVEAVNSGETLELLDDEDLAADVTLPTDVSLVVPQQKVLTVPAGKQLVVDGTLWMDGGTTLTGSVVVNGKLSKCTKLVVQQGQADGVPFKPYGDKKYWKTTCSTPTISLPSGVTATAHATVVNGLGETFRIAVPDSARVLTVTRDASVAENHITGVSSVSPSDDLTCTTTSKMFVLLTTDCVINKSTTAKTGFSGYVDCAGNKCSTIDTQEVNGTNGAATFFNCPEFIVWKSVGTTHTFYNCQNVIVQSLNAGNPCVNSFYDCGPIVAINYNKGPSTGTCANFYSGTYDSIDSIPTQTQVIYGGRYKDDPGKEGAYLATGKSLMVKKEDGYYVVYENIAVNVAEIETDAGVQSFKTLQEAFKAVGNGQTVRLIQNYEGNDTATVDVGKNFSLELRGYSLLSTSGKIVNNGTLWIKDSVTPDATTELSVLNWAIENNGTLETTYGAYKGNFTLNAGSRLVTHGGRFLNQLVLANGVADPTTVADLRGGYFNMDLAAAGFLSQGYLQKNNWVGKFPYALVENATQFGFEKAWKVTALVPADLAIYAKNQAVRPLPRAEYGSDTDWNRRAELESMLKPYSGTIDCTLSFDRPTAENSMKVYASAKITINEALDRTMAANEVYRVMITKILGAQSTYSLFGYDRFLTGYDFTQTAIVGVADVNGANPGTVAKLELEVCHTTDRHADPQTPDLYAKDFAVATCRYMLGGGKAAIDRGTSRVTYNTLRAAVGDVQDGETILVGADTEEDVSFEKAGTFTIDPYGFAFTGSVTIDDGFFLREPATKSVSLAAAQGVSSAEAMTYVVAQKLARVGETFYVDLATAVANADTDGKVIQLTADDGETITVSKPCTIDFNGFAFTGTITGANSYVAEPIRKNGEVTGYAILASVPLAIPSVANAAVVVKVNGEVVEPVDGKVSAPIGATVEVVYSAVDGWLNDTTVTIDAVTSSSKIEVGDYAPVRLVAQVGGEKFTSLDDALAAAQTSGEPILVLGAVPETMPEGFMSIAVNGKTLLVPETEPEVVVQAPVAANFPDGVAATAKDKIVAAGPVAVITRTGVLDTDVCSNEAVLAALQAAATTEAERAQITAASEIRRYVSVQLTAVEVTAAAAFAGLSFDVKPMAKTYVIDAAGAVKVVVAQIPNDELRGGITFRLPLTDAFTASARIVHADDADRLVRVAQAADGKRYVTVTATHFSIFTVYPDSHVESALTTSNVLAVKRVPGVAGAAAGTEVVAAVPWRNVALTDDVTVDRLVATGVAEGDEIAAWMDGAKTYYTWRWNGTAWEPATDAKTGVKAPAASATTLLRGTAVWYKRANPSSAYSQVGGYDPATVKTAVTQGGATSELKPANTLLINPYDEAVDLTQIPGASGDQIQTLADLKVYTYKDGRWGTMQLVEMDSPFGPVKKQKFVPAEGSVVVPAGQGFWYISKGGQPEIDWKEIEITAGE